MYSRRSFLRQAGLYTGLLAMSSLFGKAVSWAADKLPLIDMSKNTPATNIAKSLGYVADATKADRPERGGVAGKDQTCANCQFFTDKDGPGGTCQLIMPTEVQVHDKGWCKSWVKKA